MSRWLDKQRELEIEHLGETLVAEPDPAKWTQGSFHVWQRGDSLVDIARDMHVPYKQLLEANEIESYTELEEGVPIYYPAPKPDSSRKIEVEIKHPVLYMHVGKPGGAKKWMFGSMETFEDAVPAGFYPERTNLIIAAVVKVPIRDQDNENAEAAYYIDHNALGDYETSGLLRFTLGFAWSDLEHGHVETLLKKTEPAPAPEVVHIVEDITEEEVEETVVAPKFSREYIQEILNSYQTLPEVRECISVLPENMEGVHLDPQTNKRYIWIKDFTGKRQDLPLYDLYDVEIGATFSSNGVLYGQPVESMEDKIFFGVPLSILQSHNDLYNNEVDPQTRDESGLYITWFERYVWIPANKWLSKNIPGYMQKINKKGNEK